jgi:uncharacterized membrane protein
MTNEDKINLIGQKILILSNNLDKYKAELLQLQQQLDNLKTQQQGTLVRPPVIPVETETVRHAIQKDIQEIPLVSITKPTELAEQQSQFQAPFQQPVKAPSGFNFEEFIGARLINIIGIIILVIGMGIGVKYAIDKDLLGPLARIVLAYIAGSVMLALALKLKAKFKTFSAILLSGGMASLYFTTFVAYSLYGLFPQLVAFSVMVIFTAFTVFAATVYALEIIGIIGLVGAYAVPMLLSDGSGKIGIMFAYMTIINSGILVLSFKKLWRVLNYFAFGFTWLIVLTWFLSRYNYAEHLTLTLAFSFLFFLIFYLSNLSYKMLRKESFNAGDVINILLNSFIFFGIGYAALNHERYADYLGLFALANAVIHLVFAYAMMFNTVLSAEKPVDRRLFYLLMALVLSFFTIAVPVQLNGNWVTLLWSIEALLIFAIGRFKGIRLYEWLGYMLVFLSVGSLLQDWGRSYHSYTTTHNSWQPFFNIHLFTSLFVAATLGAIHFIHSKKSSTDLGQPKSEISKIMEYIIPSIVFVITYFSFSYEISTFYEVKFHESLKKVASDVTWAEPGAINELYDYSWLKLKNIVLHIYNLLFFSVLTMLAIRKWQNTAYRWSVFILSVLAILAFLLAGLHELRDLRNYYLNDENLKYFTSSALLIYIRYICFALFAVLLYLIHLLLKKAPFGRILSRIYSGGIVHILILVLLSVELVHLNIVQHYEPAEKYFRGTQAVYKIGLTSLWGIYSFILIAFGIFKKRQTVRITAISVFAVTLLKLLIYDTWNLATGYKVIAYMLLGIILLIVAFLYQKFKHFIFSDGEKETVE